MLDLYELLKSDEEKDLVLLIVSLFLLTVTPCVLLYSAVVVRKPGSSEEEGNQGGRGREVKGVLDLYELKTEKEKEEEEEEDYEYHSGRDQDAKYADEDGVVRNFATKPPKPDKPLVITSAKDGEPPRKPKVGLLILSDFSGWSNDYYHFKKPKFGHRQPLAKLVQRIDYLLQLLDGCDVDLIFFGIGMFGEGATSVKEYIDKVGGTHFHKQDIEELYALLLRAKKYDFGLMMTIRRDRADAGMGYGYGERDERKLLRGFGLACGGNCLFGDWGSPADGGANMNSWTNLEFAGAYDCSGYIKRAVKWQIYKFCGRTPAHGSPFARLVRLDHFIRIMKDRKRQLRPKDIKRIWAAVRGEYFSEANLWATWWCLYFGLIFPKDFIFNPAHQRKWKLTQNVQSWAAGEWLKFKRFYWNSYEQEWAEVLVPIMKTAFRIVKVTFVVLYVAVVLLLLIGTYLGYRRYYTDTN